MVGMMTKVLPMLQARGIPASMAHFVNQFNPQPGYTGDTSTGYGWADVQNLVLNNGIEAHGHSWSHQEAVGARALEHETLDSRTEMETQMPKVRLKGMMVPGTTGAFWGGFTNNLADPSVWHNTEAGRLVMYNYAAANGGGGVINPLASGQTLGWQSYLLDNLTTSASAISVLSQAQDTGTGAVLMLHPNTVDFGSSNITTSVLGEILDYMVAERDAGRAMILTVTGMLHADPSRTTRHNLIRDPAFINGLARYAGTTGYTVAGNIASTTTGGVLSQSIAFDTHAYAKGSTREAYAEFRAPAGAVVRVHLVDTTSSATYEVTKDVTLPASTNWVTVRQPLSIPTTGSTTLRFEFGRVSGGAIDVRNPGLLAV